MANENENLTPVTDSTTEPATEAPVSEPVAPVTQDKKQLAKKITKAQKK